MTLVESLGSDLLVHVDAGSDQVAPADFDSNGSEPPRVGAVTARLEPSLRIGAGDKIRLSLDAERLRFFEPVGGRAL